MGKVRSGLNPQPAAASDWVPEMRGRPITSTDLNTGTGIIQQSDHRSRSRGHDEGDQEGDMMPQQDI